MIGNRQGAAFSISSRQMPASFGVQGPGDSTMASGRDATTSDCRHLVIAVHENVRPQAPPR